MLGLDSKITFGKHNGKTVQDVLAEAPDYLLWLRRPNADKKPMEMAHGLHCVLDAIIYGGGGDRQRDKPKFPREICEKFLKELENDAKAQEIAQEQFNDSRALRYGGLWGSWA